MTKGKLQVVALPFLQMQIVLDFEPIPFFYTALLES